MTAVLGQRDLSNKIFYVHSTTFFFFTRTLHFISLECVFLPPKDQGNNQDTANVMYPQSDSAPLLFQGGSRVFPGQKVLGIRLMCAVPTSTPSLPYTQQNGTIVQR